MIIRDSLLLLGYGLALLWVLEDFFSGRRPSLCAARLFEILWEGLVPLWYAMAFSSLVLFVSSYWDEARIPSSVWALPLLFLTHILLCSKHVSPASGMAFMGLSLYFLLFEEETTWLYQAGVFAYVYFIAVIFRTGMEGIRFRLAITFVPHPWEGLPVLLVSGALLSFVMFAWGANKFLTF